MRLLVHVGTQASMCRHYVYILPEKRQKGSLSGYWWNVSENAIASVLYMYLAWTLDPLWCAAICHGELGITETLHGGPSKEWINQGVTASGYTTTRFHKFTDEQFYLSCLCCGRMHVNAWRVCHSILITVGRQHAISHISLNNVARKYWSCSCETTTIQTLSFLSQHFFEKLCH